MIAAFNRLVLFMKHPLVSYPLLPDTPVSQLPFSPAVEVGDLIFVSGQASVDQQGNIVSDTFEGEFRRSIENVRRVLEAAGSDLAHVVQTRNYVRDASDVPTRAASCERTASTARDTVSARM